jgi:hypothetical protein
VNVFERGLKDSGELQKKTGFFLKLGFVEMLILIKQANPFL